MGTRQFFKYGIFAAIVALCCATGMDQPYCTDLKPQNSLDVKYIMGMWYGVEIITHLRDDDDVTIYDTCPIIHLSETGYEMTTESHVAPGSYGYVWTASQYDNDHHGREYRHLRLYWDENGNNIEYYLKFNNTRKGFWISSGPQNGGRGSMLKSKYNQFAGTVQVMKAVVDHLVLTFCQRLPESRLFTVILSRDPQQLSRQEIHSIHNLLSRRDLSTSTIRKVCRNGSETWTVSFNLIIFSIVSMLMYCGFDIL